MRKVELKTRHYLRKIFSGISLTAMAFVFQACYGPPPDGDMYDVKFTGQVLSKTTSTPIKGIKVMVDDGLSYGFTDKDGKFNFYFSLPVRGNVNKNEVPVRFLDVDGIENGCFENKTIFIDANRKNEVSVLAELDTCK